MLRRTHTHKSTQIVINVTPKYTDERKPLEYQQSRYFHVNRTQNGTIGFLENVLFLGIPQTTLHTRKTQTLAHIQ